MFVLHFSTHMGCFSHITPSSLTLPGMEFHKDETGRYMPLLPHAHPGAKRSKPAFSVVDPPIPLMKKTEVKAAPEESLKEEISKPLAGKSDALKEPKEEEINKRVLNRRSVKLPPAKAVEPSLEQGIPFLAFGCSKLLFPNLLGFPGLFFFT